MHSSPMTFPIPSPRANHCPDLGVISCNFMLVPQYGCIHKQWCYTLQGFTFYINGITLCVSFDTWSHRCDNPLPDHVTICLSILLLTIKALCKLLLSKQCCDKHSCLFIPTPVSLGQCSNYGLRRINES